MLKKNIWANFQRIIEFFTKKIVKKLLKIWSWDPDKTCSGSRINGSKRHRIPDPQHCLDVVLLLLLEGGQLRLQRLLFAGGCGFGILC